MNEDLFEIFGSLQAGDDPENKIHITSDADDIVSFIWENSDSTFRLVDWQDEKNERVREIRQNGGGT